jgi:hypothetical protein
MPTSRGVCHHLRIGGLIRIRVTDIQGYEARSWHAPDNCPQPSGSSSNILEFSTLHGGTAIQRGRAGFRQGKRSVEKPKPWLNQFIAGRGAPEPPRAPTVGQILDGYLADRRPVVRHYQRLDMAARALRRHIGDLEPEHLTKERIRFYRRGRGVEGHEVGPADARRKKADHGRHAGARAWDAARRPAMGQARAVDY